MSVWTVVFAVLAITVAGDSARSLLALPLLLGLYHLLFRLGRWADRRDASNPLSRRATALAWLFPVAFPVFIVVDAVTG